MNIKIKEIPNKRNKNILNIQNLKEFPIKIKEFPNSNKSKMIYATKKKVKQLEFSQN